jgi:integrase
MARRHRRNWLTKMRVHDLRHTYASLARRAVADLRLLQKTMGHASITVMAHVYADLCDDELDVVASALDALDDRPSE